MKNKCVDTQIDQLQLTVLSMMELEGLIRTYPGAGLQDMRRAARDSMTGARLHQSSGWESCPDKARRHDFPGSKRPCVI